LSLRNHPLAFFRKALEARGIITAQQLAEVPNDRRYKVAGLVLLRQRPGAARGITFVSLEDETGIANLVIRADVWERFRPVARAASALIARGLLERQNEVIHLVVDHLEDLSPLIAGVKQPSRDFH
jgi:error-prone DNA polymerase